MVENTNSTTLEVQGSFALTYIWCDLFHLTWEVKKWVKTGVTLLLQLADSWHDSASAGRLMTWLGDLSSSTSLCERLNRGAPLSLGTRENTLSESQSSRRGISISWLCAHREARGQVPPKPVPFETLHGDRQLGFWGASSRLPKTSSTWQKKLVKDLDHQSASEGMIVLFIYCFVFWILYMFHTFIYAASYVGMILSYLFCLIIIW
jgi:hypothetical protein